MADDPLGLIGGGAGGLTIGALLLGVWDRYFRRKEKVEDTEKSDRDHMQTYLDDRGMKTLERLDRDLARKDDELARERQRLTEVATQRDEAAREKDFAWDLAHAWKERARLLKHDLAGARGAINLHQASVGKDGTDWPDESLPGVEDIVADNVAYQARKRAWQVRQEMLRRPGLTIDPIDPPDA